jgi:fructan beta-fructosidase
MVFTGNQFPGIDSLYKEKNRPQVHFTSRRGWLNDPNGLIYYKGNYHLFYQHNPYGWAWGNMHWGHATSKDLVHWKELPDALYPMNENDAAFSGSAVVDPKNTGGFRKNGIDPLIAFYTSTGRGECMKLSYDNGKTFEDYKGNPILEHKGRDPKVFWYAPGNHWVMVVYDFGRTKKMSLGEEATINQNLIYTSPDLKNWTFQSGIPGFFECPDLFELPVEGEPRNSKWVMYDATGRYILGKFDGKKFTIEQNLKKYDNGGGYFYASQTYNNMPDNRRVQIGWGRGITHRGMPFNQPMLFPSELKLKRTADGLRLCPEPIKEISSLYSHTQIVKDKILKGDDPLSVSVEGGALHVIAEFEKGDATQFGLNVLGYELVYNDLIGQFLTTHNGPSSVTDYVKPGTDMFKIEAIVDQNILEVFVNDGELYYVLPFNGSKTGKVDAFVKGRGGDRKVILKKLEVHQLNSIWGN